MKTSDECKKGLALCSDICKSGNGCPYAIHGLDCAEELMSDSLAFFQQLEAQNAELLTKVKQLEAKCHQLERERDAAVSNIKVYNPCDVCKHNIPTETICSRSEEVDDCFEWRGVKEE